MYSIIKKYDFKIHLIISLCMSMIISLIRYIHSAKEAYSIGVIGGADGPTVIYGSDNISYLLIKFLFIINKFCFIPVFIILVLLYKPVKYSIDKIKEV
ncbi:hypothetical protein [Tepidibacter sp. Z1-5]|uniref:hypothetical protein n=1 Tax=Tepidibacter sp. Z1-5 TaxID=3134138 RepID=UPI0030BC2F4E